MAVVPAVCIGAAHLCTLLHMHQRQRRGFADGGLQGSETLFGGRRGAGMLQHAGSLCWIWPVTLETMPLTYACVVRMAGT